MNKPNVHFIGIGGIGTSALARWFLSYGYNVSGSDISYSEIISDLRRRGIRVFIGHRAKNLSRNANLAIFSAAVPANNPERQKAAQMGIPAESYAEAVGELTKKYKTIAVAGAHGKSTTTALLSLALISAGLDPTVIIGTKLKEFGNSNFKNGRGGYLVLEADEYQQSFLNYSPIAAIILNIDAEHLDFYKNLTNIKKTFLKFIESIRPNGILVVNKDDKNIFNLKNRIEKIGKKRNLEIRWYSRHSPALADLRRVIKIPGEHNASNALAVYALAKTLKIKDKDIFNALSRYQGAWRRMEYRGELRIKNLGYRNKKTRETSSILNPKFSIPVYDDYAHHPTEIKATLSGIAQKWPKMPLICIFQPHQAKRLSLLFKDFVRAFNKANALVLLPVYQVQGRDQCLSQNVNSNKLAQAIKKRINLKPKNPRLRQGFGGQANLKTVEYLPSPEKLPNVLKKIIQTQFLKTKSYQLKANVIMMGAGDIYKYTKLLIK